MATKNDENKIGRKKVEGKSEEKAKVRRKSVKNDSSLKLTPQKISNRGGGSKKNVKNSRTKPKKCKNHSQNV